MAKRRFFTSKIRRTEILEGWMFIIPVVLGTLLFNVLPLLPALVLSFFTWDGFSQALPRGFGNYVDLFHDIYFLNSVKVTVLYTGGTVLLTTASALALAVLINRRWFLITTFRGIFFLPVMTSMVAIGMVWKWLFNTQLGLINYLLRPFITAPIRWLGLPGTTLFVVIFVTAWHSMGYYMVIFLAGLQSIPEQLYEVAEINGANGWQKFRTVTWPLMTPITFFIILMITFSAVRSFDIIYVMIGETESATGVNVYAYRLYVEAFMYFKMGYASSMAWLLFVALAALTMLQWYLSKKWVYYE